MESKVRHGYDALLVLVAPGAAAVTADTVSTKLDINRIANGRGDVAGRYGQYKFDVIFHVKALDFGDSDEVYSLDFYTYDSAGANGVLQRSVSIVAGDIGKTLVQTFDCDTLAEKDADAAQFAVTQNVAGTTPSCQVWAFVAPEA